MKTIHFIPIAAALLCAAAIWSCNGDGDKNSGPKLLVEIRTTDRNSTRFEYDKQNRIVKVDGLGNNGQSLNFIHTLTYSKSDLVRFDDLVITSTGPNQLLFTDGNLNITLDLNDDGTVAKMSFTSAASPKRETVFQYHNGNPTKITYWASEGVPLQDGIKETTYDSSHSPFVNCATPIWWLIWRFEGMYGVTNNNPAEVVWKYGAEDGSVVYTYDYDEDNFPTCKYTDGVAFEYYIYNK